MPYVVTENCIACKYMDCVEVCPVDCFYEGENMLVIDPDECIDCGVCEPECPADAIVSDTRPHLDAWIGLNRHYARIWPNITERRSAPEDADVRNGEPGKLAHLSPQSGRRLIMVLERDMARTEHVGAATASVSPAITEVGDRVFKDAMAGLAFSIAVVTAAGDEGPVGRTVTSFMPLSVDPPRLLVSIDAGSRLAAAIRAGACFSVSFLGEGQDAVGDAFAGKRPVVERFAVGEWGCWPSGNPRLRAATLALDCRVTTLVDAGDHTLFVGTLIAAEAGAVRPLVWHDRRYRLLDG